MVPMWWLQAPVRFYDQTTIAASTLPGLLHVGNIRIPTEKKCTRLLILQLKIWLYVPLFSRFLRELKAVYDDYTVQISHRCWVPYLSSGFPFVS